MIMPFVRDPLQCIPQIVESSETAQAVEPVTHKFASGFGVSGLDFLFNCLTKNMLMYNILIYIYIYTQLYIHT